MFRILFISLISSIIIIDSFAQTQLDVQGSETSSDDVAQIKLNYSGPDEEVVGLSIDALSGRSSDIGIELQSSGTGISADASSVAISASSINDYGIYSSTTSATKAGIFGTSLTTSPGIFGFSISGVGVQGQSETGPGLIAVSVDNYGLSGESMNSYGAYLKGATGNLLLAATTGFGNGDDSVIRTQEDLPDGDLYLISNDATVVQLDADDNSAGRFLIKNDGDIDVFEMRENGNMLVRSETGTIRLEVEEDGDVLVGGAMVLTSDRNQKEEIIDIEQDELLQSLKDLPIYEWQYRGKERRHIGPMAQDFHAAFGLGDDDKTIATIDADGIALAAIQAQQELIEEQSLRIDQQTAIIESLLQRLDQIEQKLKKEKETKLNF